MIDITGEASVEVLLALSSSGKIEQERLMRILGSRKPGTLLLWSHSYAAVVKTLHGRVLYKAGNEGENELPIVMTLTWPDET